MESSLLAERICETSLIARDASSISVPRRGCVLEQIALVVGDHQGLEVRCGEPLKSADAELAQRRRPAAPVRPGSM